MTEKNNYFHIIINGKLSTDESSHFKNVGAVISSSNSLIGGDTITEILMVLSSPLVLKSIKEIVLGLINSKRRVTIKTSDFEIVDIDEKAAKEIIEKLIEHQNKNNETECGE